MSLCLEVSNLHVAVRGLHRQPPALILRGVDLAVESGEVHALVGESGAGKSLVGRTVLGVTPTSMQVMAGQVKFMGLDYLGLAPAQRRLHLGRDLALIPQDPLTALNPGHTIGSQVGDVLRLHLCMTREQARARTLDLLEAVQIRSPATVVRQYPHELSGGMRQRVLIAIAFACKPRLIIADEPTTALDVTVQREVLRLLRALQREEGAAVLFITHNLGLVAKLSDRVSVIHAGRIVEHGSVRDIIEAPRTAYTRSLFAATPRYDRPAEALQPIAEDVTDALWAEARAYDQGWWAGHGAEAGWRVADPLLSVEGLGLALPDLGSRPWFGRAPMRQILQDIDLQVEAGECVGLVGESGSGKTTLARTLLRLHEPQRGEIVFAGREVTHMSEAEMRPLRARLQMIFQDPLSALNPRHRVGEIVVQPLLAYGRLGASPSRQVLQSRAAELLEQVSLPPGFAARYPHELSGGQRQRVGIARAIALGPDLILADEIVSGLDVSTQARILLLLRDLRQRLGLAMLFVTHDLSVVRVLCDKVVVLKDGRVVEQGATAAVFQRPRHAYTRALLEAVPLPEIDDTWLPPSPPAPPSLTES